MYTIYIGMKGSRAKTPTTTSTKKMSIHIITKGIHFFFSFFRNYSALQLLLGIFVYAPSCIFCQIEGEVECVCVFFLLPLSLSARVCVCAHMNTYNSHYMHTLSERILLSFAEQTFRFSTPLNGRNVHKYSNKHTVAHIRIRMRHSLRQYFPLCRLT